MLTMSTSCSGELKIKPILFRRFFFKKDTFNINCNGDIDYISVDDYLNNFNSRLIQALNENKSKKILLCFVTKMRNGDKVEKKKFNSNQHVN